MKLTNYFKGLFQPLPQQYIENFTETILVKISSANGMSEILKQCEVKQCKPTGENGKTSIDFNGATITPYVFQMFEAFCFTNYTYVHVHVL